MKKTVLVILTACLLTSPVAWGQSFDALWKQVGAAKQKDLPRTEQQVVRKIISKADRERAYGQLVRALVYDMNLQEVLSADSISPALTALKQREQTTKDQALKAVLDVAISRGYDMLRPDNDWRKQRDEYRQRALQHPEMLSSVKTDGYKPAIVKERDSELFGHDLLSVVGYELEAWQWMSDYYTKAGNRRAACLTGVRTLTTVEGCDSMIARYGDLQECGEVAIKRYQLMERSSKYSDAARYDWLQQSLRRWGDSRRANELRNELTLLTNPVYQAELPQRVSMPDEPQTLMLKQLRNLQQVTLRIYRTQLAGDTQLNPNDKDDYNKMKGGLTERKDLLRTLTVSGRQVYEQFSDSLTIGGLPAGVYLLELESRPQTETVRMLYFVSRLRTIVQPMPDKTMRYVVVDARTGQPVSGAQLRLSFRRGWREKATTQLFTCNKDGEFIYAYGDQHPVESYAYTTDDRYCPTQDNYGTYSYYERQYNSEHVNLFTDRSIYRPGQTVTVTAIAWKELSALDNHAVEGRTLTLQLRDANYKVVAEQQATTDRYGKCSVCFQLPTDKLNGRFTISTKNGSTSFRVEEYKRPTFEVRFDDYKESYQRDDTIRVKGRAASYAGVPVQGGKVSYVIRRRVAFWWMNYSYYWQQGTWGRSMNDVEISRGECVTADDGTFLVDMPLQMPSDVDRQSPMFYHFVVEADVTDMAGETRTAVMSLPLGSKRTALTCNLAKQVRSDLLTELRFTRMNAAGKEIGGQVRYRIDGGKWKTCDANTSVPLGELASGSHRLEATCEDSQGNDRYEMTFVVFSLNDTKPATKTDDWFYVSAEEFPDDGSPVTLQVGSSDSALHMVYALYAGNTLIERGAVKKDGALENRRLTYKEEYGNGLLMTYAWVKNGRCHHHETFIRRPMPKKQLQLAWTTFRDRLTPGQQEEWRLTVKRPDGTPADASMMAVLYDQSLDAISTHQWSFAPQNWLPQPSTSWHMPSWGSLYESAALNYRLLDVPAYRFSHFDEEMFQERYFAYTLGGRTKFNLAAASTTMESANMKSVMVRGTQPKAAAIDAVQADMAVAQEEKEERAEGAQENETAQSVQMRENLNETAFCYPTVKADKDGQVVLTFTLPESLTTWRFMGVANTPDMLYGALEGKAVATKDVMIQPNMPRFIRMGDEAQLSARIFNTTDHPIEGQAVMQLIDPSSEQVVYQQQQTFDVESEQTASVTFPLNSSRLTSHASLLICKVMAQGDGFSDGEQHYLPVLPNEEYVTRTIPFTQHEAGVKTIDLTTLVPQGVQQPKVTIEYTNNPAWLMVQSLPTVGQPREYSAIDQAAAYYSNLLAQALLKQNSQVKGVFEQWKHASPSTLHSSLQKNQELKDLVLDETPWMLAADREQEQRQLLGDFFDENTISQRLASAAGKLQELQRPDGSFAWYPGMEGSTHITVAVAEMLARLHVMIGNSSSRNTLNASLDKAFRYIGQEMVETVGQMKKEERKGIKPSFPSFTALRWLYICAIDGRQLPKDVQTANNYLIALLKKDIKRQTIYEKALTAVVLAQRGERVKAAEYVRSLKEYTVYSEEMGRYYDTRRAAYSWYDYKIPTEVAAIEALQRITPNDQQTIDEMRRWLLQEKRTQAWSTPINSVNAIYAFLYGHPQTLTTHQPATKIAVDGSPIDTPNSTAAIGYVKTVIADSKGTALTFDKTSEGTSWGAVYAQFFQKTSDIEAAESGISVKREVLSEKGEPLTTSLTVGQRVKVRITIQTTRDLDFVQVVDRRAACMEPVSQLSGYRNGAYTSPKDNATHYFFGGLAKGRHVIETTYFIDRAGTYETGTCSVGCAYAPEYRATAPSVTLTVQ